MDLGYFTSLVTLQAMGFAFLIVGAKMADWTKPITEFCGGVFVFLAGCVFSTIWLLGVFRLAQQLYWS